MQLFFWRNMTPQFRRLTYVTTYLMFFTPFYKVLSYFVFANNSLYQWRIFQTFDIEVALRKSLCSSSFICGPGVNVHKVLRGTAGWGLVRTLHGFIYILFTLQAMDSNSLLSLAKDLRRGKITITVIHVNLAITSHLIFFHFIGSFTVWALIPKGRRFLVEFSHALRVCLTFSHFPLPSVIQLAQQEFL